ncbi:MAG: hypothetical protein PHF33_05740 [Candidatus Delongbacteria bacterium]|nr:hypothetical protein [Candidatus Delongbacteria bacterium]MDD4204509.1 hypothetical protein [Candidatus Delongbacteria bacterium]
MKLQIAHIERIVEECYWDYKITPVEIINIADGNDNRLKKKLFEKILHNSSRKLYDLDILFDKVTLKQMFDEFKPSYNMFYIERYVLVLRNLMFGENNRIEALEWEKR